jgi:hypothetical protein
MRFSRRQALVSIVGAAVAPVCLFAASGQASAVVPTARKVGHFRVAYHHSWTFVATKLTACGVFDVTGDISYNLWKVTDGSHYAYVWKNQTLTVPTLSLTIRAYHPRSRQCARSKSASKVLISQHWTGNGMRFQYTTRYGRGSRYFQYNSGSPSTFGTYISRMSFTPPCYGVRVSGTIWEGRSSSSYGSGAKKVCLSRK